MENSVAADKALHQEQEPRCSQEQLADDDLMMMRSDIRGVESIGKSSLAAP